MTDASPPLHTHVSDSNSHPSSPRLLPSERSPSKGKIHIIVPAVVVPLVLSVTIALVIVFCIRYRKRKRQVKNVYSAANYHNSPPVTADYPTQEVKNDLASHLASLQYKMGTLQAATNNFSHENEIGRGGFGVVYKGILADGQEIAVKRLSNISNQGDEEFKNEVSLLAKLQHRNLVRLMGFAITNKDKLLVYSFMSNKSLDCFLFGLQNKGELDWPRRYNIIRGIARGMLYLHEDSPIRIIHRDLKAANVLLDVEMNPKVADFGLARVCAFEKTHVDTSRIAGTHGYMAPEYIFHGQFSTKSDVYSFGVLILEIISGRRVAEFCYTSGGSLNLLCHAWTCWLGKEPLKLVDPSLGDSCSEDEVTKCIHLGLLCVQGEISKRPTMVTIVHTLNTNYSVAAETLAMPHPPTFLYNNSSSDQMTTRSNNS